MKSMIVLKLIFLLSNIATMAFADIQSECSLPSLRIRAGGACFGADTKVDTPTGPVPISELKVGDEVLSLNEKSGQIVVDIITDTAIHSGRLTCTLDLDDQTALEVTPGHVFYSIPAVRNNRDPIGRLMSTDTIGSMNHVVDSYIPADKLWGIIPTGEKSAASLVKPEYVRSGFMVQASQLRDVKIKSFSNAKKSIVYELTVRDNHNYFVEGVLVHNVSL